MSNAAPSITKELEERRKAVLRDIKALPTSPAKTLINQLLDLNAAIAAIGSPRRGEFADCRKPYETLVAYLTKIGRSAPREEIVAYIAASGYYPEDEETRPKENVKDLIRFQLKSGKHIKEVNGRIGLSSWGPEMFSGETSR